jgi:hypothetical protein
MGGKAKSSNNQQIQFEMQQAAQAQQKEAERQARLASGTQTINDIFTNANFNDDFYNKYGHAITDYQMPQLDTQFSTAKRKLTADLARSGNLLSSDAVRASGLQANEYEAGKNAIQASADQQTGALRQNTAAQKQSAINQLYATEDPTIAANTAASSVQQAQIATPNLQPLSAMFTPIAVGGISGLNSYLNTFPSYNQNTGNPVNTNLGRYTA